MRIKHTFLWIGSLTVALGIGFVSGSAQETATSRIIGVYGVGGVLSDDGVLWQYMPEQRRWMTIDEAFAEGGQLAGSGQQSNILPLPVPVEEIAFMESWGFLVTHDSIAWHYDLRSNRWENVGRP
jgi:hypothetical protein